MNTHTVFRRWQSGDPIQALSHVSIHASSDALGWPGLRLEVGSNHGWHVDDLMVDGHFVGINLADTELLLQVRNETTWASVGIPPLALWINPEGQPFSLHHRQDCYWASCVIQGNFLDEVMGKHHELTQGYGIVDEPLARLLQALIALLYEPAQQNQGFISDLIKSFAHALAARHGRAAAELSIKGGIAPAQLKSLLAWLDEQLGSALTVEAMASSAGLSPAHFSREFKRSIGITPWTYVVRRRLEAARKLLEVGAPIGTAAQHTGFADQPHLSRLFKQRYGVSPSTYAKSNRKKT